MDIKKITSDEVLEHIQWIIDDLLKKLKCDNLFETNQGFYILENSSLNRIYIEIYDYNNYEGVSFDDLKVLINHFNIDDPHIFSYPYSHDESLICIGKIEENEIIY